MAALAGLAACSGDTAVTTPIERAQKALAEGDGYAAELILESVRQDAAYPRQRLAAYMGEAELLQGHLAAAREWLGPAEFDDASRAHGYHMLGRLEFLSGNLPGSGLAYDKAFGLGGAHADLWVDVGRLRYVGGEQYAAIEAAEEALASEPGNSRALLFKAQLVRDAQGNDAALPWFEAASSADPDSEEVALEYAAGLGDSFRTKRMLEVLRSNEVKGASEGKGLFLQAVLAARAGQAQLARNLLERVEGPSKEHASARLLGALIDLDLESYESATATLEGLWEEQPHNRLVAELFARSLSLSGNDRELVERFDERAKRPSASPYLRLLVGRSYEALGERKQAAWFLDNAAKPRETAIVVVQPSGGGDSGWPEQIRSHLVRGNRAAALRLADGMAEKFSGSADTLAMAGDVHAASDDLQGAIEYYEKAAVVRRPWAMAKKMVAIYQATGRERDAEIILASHVRSDPMNAEALYLLAKTLADRGEAQRAGALLDGAMRSGAMTDTSVIGLRARIARDKGDDALANTLDQMALRMRPMAFAGRR
ncbi:TPR repeat [Altererythrobacter epoxidivorans]|uniref:TPR repeat n=1 Tax=Altererythrobacter epoxidivorans TaxID=361183 RepID=A0A0M4MG68_9SPHN|nr:hypothetical protein [Altererythrobacter epoxidivorans]ALE16305.1 TPR repeat [Altererythrobacter epoxidivorans]